MKPIGFIWECDKKFIGLGIFFDCFIQRKELLVSLSPVRIGVWWGK